MHCVGIFETVRNTSVKLGKSAIDVDILWQPSCLLQATKLLTEKINTAKYVAIFKGLHLRNSPAEFNKQKRI